MGSPIAGEIARQDAATGLTAQLAPNALWSLSEMIVWHEGKVIEAVCHMRAISHVRMAQQKTGRMRISSIDLFEKAWVLAYGAVPLEILLACVTSEVPIA